MLRLKKAFRLDADKRNNHLQHGKLDAKNDISLPNKIISALLHIRDIDLR